MAASDMPARNEQLFTGNTESTFGFSHTGGLPDVPKTRSGHAGDCPGSHPYEDVYKKKLTSLDKAPLAVDHEYVTEGY